MRKAKNSFGKDRTYRRKNAENCRSELTRIVANARLYLRLPGGERMRFVIAVLLLVTTSAVAQTIPVPRAMGPIPMTAESHPLHAVNVAEPRIDFAAHGYV